MDRKYKRIWWINDYTYRIGYKYFFRRLVVLDKIMADLVKTEAKMATGQLHFKGILNYCRFGYCSK